MSRFVDWGLKAGSSADLIVPPWQRPAPRPYPVSRPALSARARVYLDEVVESGWWGYGPVAQHLEKSFAARLDQGGVALATSSCTAALHLALLSERIGLGDEVIVPAFTYVSTAAVVCYCGATPVFADIEPESLMLDWRAVEARIGPRTRAVIAVHYAGQSGAFEGLRHLCDQHNLTLIEDAAHAMGSLDACGQWAGAQADYAAYSFAATKPLPSAAGGMLAFRDFDKRKSLATLSMLGLTSDTFTRFHQVDGLPNQTVIEIGHHYRINDVTAALAMAQLDEVDSIRERRMSLVERYRHALKGQPGITLLTPREGTQPCWYLMPVLVDAACRDPLRKALLARGIDTSVHYPDLSQSKAFASAEVTLPVTANTASQIISLPLFSDMTITDVDQISKAVIEALKEC